MTSFLSSVPFLTAFLPRVPMCVPVLFLKHFRRAVGLPWSHGSPAPHSPFYSPYLLSDGLSRARVVAASALSPTPFSALFTSDIAAFGSRSWSGLQPCAAHSPAPNSSLTRRQCARLSTVKGASRKILDGGRGGREGHGVQQDPHGPEQQETETVATGPWLGGQMRSQWHPLTWVTFV